jgi:hypothetical protein
LDFYGQIKQDLKQKVFEISVENNRPKIESHNQKAFKAQIMCGA